MDALLWVLVGFLSAIVLLYAAAFILWRRAGKQSRDVIKRIGRLPLRQKLRLALAVSRDERIPRATRAIPPALILYLALPIDLVPDFVPVLGQIDDLVVAVVGIGMLLRFTPRPIIEEHIAAQESSLNRAATAGPNTSASA